MNAALLLAKSKARFQTPRGPLSVEDLFDLPLTGNFSLDTVSTTVLAELDATPRKSLVVTTTKSDKIIEAKIEVLKEIIEFKQSELAAKEQAISNKQKKAKLLDALEELEKGAISKMTKEEILKELANLN